MVKENLDILCGLFGKTRQAYYQKMNYDYKECVAESIILDKVAEIRKDMPKVGGRKLWQEINDSMPVGLKVGRDALFDLLEVNGLKVKMRIRKTRTTYSNHWMFKWPNLIRDIVPTAANQVWVNDITYIGTEAKGFVYLHLVTDLYSKRIMGWCVSSTLQADFTLEALRMAIRNAGCSLTGLIHHSDRGCQYCCDRYIKELQKNDILISMTENGDPLENAVAERVNGILKMEWLNAETFKNQMDVRSRVAEVVNLYNTRRKHLSLGYKTPDQAYGMTGEQRRCWKNYYKQSSLNDEKMLATLTSPVRTNVLAGHTTI